MGHVICTKCGGVIEYDPHEWRGALTTPACYCWIAYAGKLLGVVKSPELAGMDLVPPPDSPPTTEPEKTSQ